MRWHLPCEIRGQLTRSDLRGSMGTFVGPHVPNLEVVEVKLSVLSSTQAWKVLPVKT